MPQSDYLRKKSRDDVRQASEAILGDPLKIQPSQTHNPDCLYQAFASAISAFCSPEIPEDLLSRIFNQLVARVERSSNPEATPCLEAFRHRYRSRIDSLSSSSKDRRQQGAGRRGQPTPGRR